MGIVITKVVLLVTLMCLTPPDPTSAFDFLPTIFWNPENPALARKHWSKVINVNIFQSLTFLCPTNLVNIVRLQSPNPFTQSYYNLYVRELSPNDTNLDYNTICDKAKSNYIFSCNQSRNAPHFTADTYKRFQINTKQADSSDPKFKYNKDYIFFSTSDGSKPTLNTASTKCTMVFRIHFCHINEICPISKCATYGRDKVCMLESAELNTTSPRHVQVTAKTTTSLTISWKEPSNIASNVTYYSICYRESLAQACHTKLVEPHARSAILQNLNASTEYRIRVRTHTSKGPGDYSTEITQETSVEPLTSSEPKQVTISDITDSSVKLTWQKPYVVSGDVRYYSICYRERSQKTDCIPRLVEPEKFSAVVNYLMPSTKYGIFIRAHTSKGTGNSSKEIPFTTVEPLTSSEPKEVTISDITDSSVKLIWQKPDVVTGDVRYYSICCQEPQSLEQRCVSRLVEPQMRFAVVSNLKPSTKYDIHIRAHTDKGPGNYSKEIRFNTTCTDSQDPNTGARSVCDDSSAIHALSLVIGIIIGCVVLLIVCVILRYVTRKRRKQPTEIPVLQEMTNEAYRRSIHADMLKTVNNTDGNYNTELPRESRQGNVQI